MRVNFITLDFNFIALTMSSFFKEIKQQLHFGVHKRGHSFRFGVLATVGLNNSPEIRTIVLRDVSEPLKLTFFTDQRSNKIAQIRANNRVSLLFYNPDKMLQVKVEGKATVITNEEKLKNYWNDIPSKAKKDYTTERAPGSTITAVDEVSYLDQGNYFCCVEITPNKIEYLQLKRSNHLRVQFLKIKGDWKEKFLVP